jgi:hypothetical protein
MCIYIYTCYIYICVCICRVCICVCIHMCIHILSFPGMMMWGPMTFIYFWGVDTSCFPHLRVARSKSWNEPWMQLEVMGIPDAQNAPQPRSSECGDSFEGLLIWVDNWQWILGIYMYILMLLHCCSMFYSWDRWVWKIWLDVPESLGQGGGNSGYFFEGPLCTELMFSLATVSCGEGLLFSGALDATWSLSCYDIWKWGTSTIAEMHGYLIPSLVASNSWIGRFPLQRFTAGFNLQAAKCSHGGSPPTGAT